MTTQNSPKISRMYLFSVLLLMLVFPLISVITEYSFHPDLPLMPLTGKWFVFWAIGMRLLTAGLRQAIKPAFTAEEIFHIKEKSSQVIVRELGFANICFGLTGILSIFMPAWLPAAAFTGGLYMGIAGVNHMIKKPSTPNEVLAMVSDLFILLVMAAYLYAYLKK